jgi:hypothetical protein
MIKGMDDFQTKCREALIDWYKETNKKRIPAWDETYIVWSCKTLQNYKCLASTSLPDTIYAEFTYNGDKGEIYRDIYTKLSNTVIMLSDLE